MATASPRALLASLAALPLPHAPSAPAGTDGEVLHGQAPDVAVTIERSDTNLEPAVVAGWGGRGVSQACPHAR